MNRSILRRLAQLERVLGSVPIPHRVVEAAFETFRTKGELPDEQRLACYVVERAKRGYPLCDTGDPVLDRQRNFRVAVTAPKRPDDPVMDELYDEAVFAPGVLRDIARQVLISYAGEGVDVSLSLFANQEISLPEFGSVGLYLMGFPDCLVAPPHEARARRWIATWPEVRNRVGERDAGWSANIWEELRTYEETGALPEDPDRSAVVVAFAEMLALMGNVCGHDVTATLAAVDAAVGSVW